MKKWGKCNIEEIKKHNADHYESIAQKGSHEAAFILGMIYHLGAGVKEDKELARSWFEKSAADGFANAQYMMGLLCKDETNECFDLDRAKEFFQLAAKQKYALAQHLLGHMSYWGTMDEPKDIEKAKDWFSKASRRKSSEAQNMLAAMHYYGIGFDQSYAEAMKWFQKASKRKDVEMEILYGEPGLILFSCFEARFNLAGMYKTGLGGFKNSRHASYWASSASDMGRKILPNDDGKSIERQLERGIESGEAQVLMDEDDVDFMERHNAQWCLQYARKIYGVATLLGVMHRKAVWFTDYDKGESWIQLGNETGDVRAKIALDDNYTRVIKVLIYLRKRKYLAIGNIPNLEQSSLADWEHIDMAVNAACCEALDWGSKVEKGYVAYMQDTVRDADFKIKCGAIGPWAIEPVDEDENANKPKAYIPANIKVLDFITEEFKKEGFEVESKLCGAFSDVVLKNYNATE